MGMFDYIKFEDYSNLPKPDNFNFDLKDLEFQTKSLDSTMSFYIIKKDGSLYMKKYFDAFDETTTEEIKDKKETKIDFHGKIVFYSYHQTDLLDYILDYEAKFTDGLLKEINLINYEVVEHESLKIKQERLAKELEKENNKLSRKIYSFLSKLLIVYPLSFLKIKIETLNLGSFKIKNYFLVFHKPNIIFGFKSFFNKKTYGISLDKLTTELCFIKGTFVKEFSFKVLGFGFTFSKFENLNFLNKTNYNKEKEKN